MLNPTAQHIADLKEKWRQDVLILGHHYQMDDIIPFADFRGDSLDLSRKAAQTDRPFIVFCGVHFMAEVADMLTSPNQRVLLPNIDAGCSMANLASRVEVERAWARIARATTAKIVPLTYINSTADIKAFVGEHEGSICTSSNARTMIDWALRHGEKLFFFPDQHLGRNTAYAMGIPLDKMVVYDPDIPDGGLSDDDITNARVILWYGFCSVHQLFTANQIRDVRKQHPGVRVIVHPECNFTTVQSADDSGSTSYIVTRVREAPSGSTLAIGTEWNLVERLRCDYPDKTILHLSDKRAICPTMARIRPYALLAALQSIDRGDPINIVRVPDEIKTPALRALSTMLENSK